MTTPEIYFSLSLICVKLAFAIIIYPQTPKSLLASHGQLTGFSREFRIVVAFMLCGSTLVSAYLTGQYLTVQYL